jgi:M6 family metalloprotease-like protein
MLPFHRRCLLAVLLGLAGRGTLAAQGATATGTLLMQWGDADRGTRPAKVAWTLAGDRGELWNVDLTEAQVRAAGGMRALNRSRVTVVGTATAGTSRARGAPLAPRLRAGAIRPADAGGGASLMASPPQSGAKPYALLLCKFADNASEPRPRADFTTLLSGSFPNLDHYYREISAGQMNLGGSQAFGWFTLPQPRAAYVPGGSLAFSTLAADCTAAADASVNFANFSGIIIQVNGDLDGFAWGGSSYLALDGVTRLWPMTWMPLWATQSSMHGAYAHEVGHSLGLPHSSGPYSATYDSRWDVMSNSYLTFNGATGSYIPGHTNIYHKDLLGWIPPARKVTVTTGAPTILLEQAEVPTAGNTALEIVVPIEGTSQFYTVEARRLLGYDTPLPGEAVIIHLVTPFMNVPSKVVDPDGNGDPNDAGAMWLPGETFTGLNGIRIQVNSRTTQGWSVTVTMPAPPATLTVGGLGTGGGVVSSSPAGINCTSTAGSSSGACVASFAGGSVVSLTPTVTSGSFVGWGGACSGSGSCQVTMDQARAVTAAFQLGNQTLAISATGSGSGIVRSSLEGINCSSVAGVLSGTCTAAYPQGTVITLTADATVGAFTGWSGACSGTGDCTVSLTQVRNVMASFIVTNRTLTTALSGNGSGRVTSTPVGIDCVVTRGVGSGSCTAEFAEGTIVTLAATAGPGPFAGWGGACSGAGGCVVTLSDARTVTARFEPPTFAVAVTAAGGGSGAVTSQPGLAPALACLSTAGTVNGACAAEYLEGTMLTLTATATAGAFGGWSGGCSGFGSCQVTVTQARSVTADFIAPQLLIDDFARALLGEGAIAPEIAAQLDAAGNRNGVRDLGDLVALMDRSPTPRFSAVVMRALQRRGGGDASRP